MLCLSKVKSIYKARILWVCPRARFMNCVLVNSCKRMLRFKQEFYFKYANHLENKLNKEAKEFEEIHKADDGSDHSGLNDFSCSLQRLWGGAGWVCLRSRAGEDRCRSEERRVGKECRSGRGRD